MRFSYEQGPIRPPSEAKSLLIRVTRNCPWNKCAFCHTYRDTKFQIRSVQDVKADIQKAKDIADQIKEISWKIGQEGRINEFVVNYIYQNDGFYNDSFKGIAAWLFFGGKSVFLQDADTIIIKQMIWLKLFCFLKNSFLTLTGLPHTVGQRRRAESLLKILKVSIMPASQGFMLGWKAAMIPF